MKDSEIITDLLLTEKKMSNNYSTYASECTNTKLRDAFVDILTQGHRTQTKLYETGQQKGWYSVTQAQPQQIQQVEQKFSNQAPTIN